MNHNSGLTVLKSVAILLLVALWVIFLVLFFSQVTYSSAIYPTVWIFSSAILLMLFLLIRFQGKLKIVLFLKPCTIKWITLSVLISTIFWLINSYLAGDFKSNNEDIKAWQHNVLNFNLLSVGLSSVILAPIFEEMYFRGLLLTTLKKNTSSWLAVSSSAVLFALIHWSWPELVSLMTIGLICGWMTLKSNSILPAMLAHIIHNALTFGLYSQ